MDLNFLPSTGLYGYHSSYSPGELPVNTLGWRQVKAEFVQNYCAFAKCENKLFI